MPVIRPILADDRRALARAIRAQVKAAAGDDRLLDDAEKQALSPFLAGAAAQVPSSPASVDDVVDVAMGKAMAAWARHNQSRGSGSAFLSKKELQAIAAEDADLGALSTLAVQAATAKKNPPAGVDVRLESDVPGLTMSKYGDRYTLKAMNSVPVDSKATLIVEGLRVDVIRRSGGLQVDFEPPPGFGAEEVKHELGATPTSTWRITRDPPGSLDDAAAREAMKAAVAKHLKEVRIHEGDWEDYFPTTWDEVVAGGVLDDIARFVGDPETEFGRRPDRYVAYGRGPYDLYTEVEVAKEDGRLLRCYVEID